MISINRIVDRLYDGVADHGAWGEALTMLCDAVSAHHAVAMAARLDAAAHPFVAASRVAPDHLRNFAEATMTGPIGWLEAIPPGKVLDFQAVMPRPEFVRTDFFTDVVRPMGGYRAMISIPIRRDGAAGFIALCRPEHSEDFEAREIAAVARVVPHVNRVLRARLAIDRAAEQAEALVGAIDRIDALLAVVDAELRPIFMSGGFEEVVGRGDGLYRSRAGLTAAHPGDAARLRELVRVASRDDARAPNQHVLRLRRASGLAAWSVVVCRVGAFERLGGLRPAVALILEDPTRRPDHLPAMAATLFGLTAQQAALAAQLAHGRDLDAAAAALGIGRGTARNYLKIIFAKTGTRRQAELVGLLLRSARFSR